MWVFLSGGPSFSCHIYNNDKHKDKDILDIIDAIDTFINEKLIIDNVDKYVRKKIPTDFSKQGYLENTRRFEI